MSDDPGWGSGWTTVVGAVAPQVAIVAARRSGRHGLIVIRQTFVSFCGTPVLVGVVLALIGDMAGVEPNVARSLAIVVAVGVIGVVLSRVVKHTLDCSTDQTLAAGYRTRFFLRLALCNGVGLIAFVVGMVFGPWWIYYASLPFVAVGFALLAPTVRRVAAEQQRLSSNGCHRSIVDALGSTDGQPGQRRRGG